MCDHYKTCCGTALKLRSSNIVIKMKDNQFLCSLPAVVYTNMWGGGGKKQGILCEEYVYNKRGFACMLIGVSIIYRSDFFVCASFF